MAGHGVDEGDNVPERVVGPALLDLDRGIDGALGVQLFRLFAAAVVARFGPDAAARIGPNHMGAFIVEERISGGCQSGREGEERVRLVADDVGGVFGQVDAVRLQRDLER